MELLFNRLNSAQLNWYFNWQSWDYETHPEGECYTMSSVFDWFFTGYIVDAIRNGGIYNTPNFDANIVDGNINPQNKILFIRNVKRKIRKRSI